jgi:hypothetical protein
MRKSDQIDDETLGFAFGIDSLFVRRSLNNEDGNWKFFFVKKTLVVENVSDYSSLRFVLIILRPLSGRSFRNEKSITGVKIPQKY